MQNTHHNLNNHEDWHVCWACGTEFDRHLHGFECPDCGYNPHKVKTGLFFAVLFFVLIAVLNSCTSVKYAVRHHKCNLSQQTEQLQYCISSRQDLGRAARNWDRRPHNHWPFNFLQ